MKFGDSGHYTTIVKSGDLLHFFVTHGSTKTGYYIHGDSVGLLPSGFTQNVFVSQRKGLRPHIEELIAQQVKKFN